ncbi:hypothetical protein [Naasia sp. SYSU D00057]|uniref:hypothetical protein n=1 Tax=Naasia sp. SYSU D00057 TaxID=2817380 RepID=UPI001B30F450|nr:hypothetical protein [Naasia sp. SYSU D00057]
MRDAAGTLLERVLLCAPAGAPASGVLAHVLGRSLVERRRGRRLEVDGPPEVVALLALTGLGDLGDVRR